MISERGGELERNMGRGTGVSFEGKVAVVTGAGRGLGRAYALELARRGAKVVVNDPGIARDGTGGDDTSPAESVAREIRSLGGEAVANFDSVSTQAGGKAIVEKAVKAFGRIDILINNAGILRDKTLINLEPDSWDAVIGVHLTGTYNVTRPAFAVMKEQGYGRIVVTTSSAGLFGNFGQTNYAAAKMGVVGFMNALKLEGAKYNILVNAVSPMAATRLTQDLLPEPLLSALKPEYVAPIVLFLCSEECRTSGGIYLAGAGYFARAGIVTGRGVVLGGGSRTPTVEEVAENWDGINSMEGAREFPDAPSSTEPMLRLLKEASQK